MCPGLPSPHAMPQLPLTRTTVDSRTQTGLGFWCPRLPAQASGPIQHQGRGAGDHAAAVRVRTGPPGFVGSACVVRAGFCKSFCALTRISPLSFSLSSFSLPTAKAIAWEWGSVFTVFHICFAADAMMINYLLVFVRQNVAGIDDRCLTQPPTRWAWGHS